MIKPLRILMQAFALCLIATSISCSSDDEGTTPVVDGTEDNLTNGIWIINSASANFLGAVQTEEYVHVTNCNQDYWDFNSDGTYAQVFHQYNGATCTETVYNGTYSLNGQTIVLDNVYNPTSYDFLNDITTFQLEALNDTNLTIGADVEQQGATIHATLNFTKE